MNVRDCDSTRKLISEYLDSSLDESALSAVGEHIANCESCREEYLFEKSIRESCRQIEDVELPGDFRGRLHSRLMDTAKAIGKTENKKRIFNIDRKWVGVFSSIAAGIIIFVTVGGVTGSLFGDVFQSPKNGNEEYTEYEKADGTQKMLAKDKAADNTIPAQPGSGLTVGSEPLSAEEQERKRNAPRGMGGMDPAPAQDMAGNEAPRHTEGTEELLYSANMDRAKEEYQEVYIERDSHALIKADNPEAAEAEVRNIVARVGGNISDEQLIVPGRNMGAIIAGYEDNDKGLNIVAVLPYDKYELLIKELSAAFPELVNDGLNERDLTSYAEEQEEELLKNNEHLDELENKKNEMPPNTSSAQDILTRMDELSAKNNEISSQLETIKSNNGKVYVVITIVDSNGTRNQ